MSSLKLVIGNFFLSNTGSGTAIVAETAPGATMSVRASVSTDLSNWTRVQFAGADTGTVGDGALLESDETAVDIADGETFYVRIWKQCAAGITYAENAGDPALNHLFRIGTSVTDNTGSGTFSGNANSFSGGPVAILTRSRRPAFLLLGDSIAYGFDDQDGGDRGRFAPSVAPHAGYIMAARSSDAAEGFLLSSALRVSLSNYCSHVLLGFGRNDLDNLRTAAEIGSDLESIAALFPDKPVWADTVPPRTSSTDGWATTGNQTKASTEAERLALNAAIAGGLTGVAKAVDTAAAVTDNGFWGAGFTDDGEHPNGAGYAEIENTSGLAEEIAALA